MTGVFNLDEDELVALLFDHAKRIVCRGTTLEERELMRKRFHSKAFRISVIGGRSQKHYSDFVVHHKLPILLGGTNDRSNLALTEYSLEKAIHRFIGHQRHPHPNERVEMLIPVLSGSIWSLKQLTNG